jgi:hypothetical protein
MKQNLKEEIDSIRKNMGLISEDIRTQGIELAGKILKFLQTKTKKTFGGIDTNPYKKEIDELTKYIERGSSKNSGEIEDIFSKLMKSEPKIEKMLGDMIYTEWKKQNPNAFSQFEKYLINRNFDRGINYTDHLERLEKVVNDLKLKSGFQNKEIIDAIKTRLKTDIEKLSFKKYNTWHQQFMKGMWDSKKFDQRPGIPDIYTFTRYKGEEWFRKIKEKITAKPWGKWENFYKKFGYTPEQTRVLTEWYIAGFPDTPAIRKSFKQKGILYALGRGSMQLLTKYIQLTLIWWGVNSLIVLFEAIIEDEPSPEYLETLENYGETAVVIEKILSSLDLAPGLKYTSPAAWAGFGLWGAVRSAQVDRKRLKDELIAYAKPDKNGKLSIKPYVLLKNKLTELKKYRDNIFKKIEKIKPTVIPVNPKQDTTTPTPAVTTDTSRLKEFKKFLKDEYPNRTFDNPIHIGGNKYKISDDYPVTFEYENGKFIAK